MKKKHKQIIIYVLLFLTVLCLQDNVQAAPLVIPDNRRIDWSLAGVPGGIPHRTSICTTAYCNILCGSGAPAACTGIGATVTTATLSAAINSAGTDQVVRLPAGTFSLSSQLVIQRSHVVLRGMGKGVTILQPTHANSVNDYYILIGTGGYLDSTGKSGGVPQETRPVTGGATKGSTSIVVGDASTLASGQTILISAAKEDWMWERNNTYANLPTQIVMISNIAGNTVHFSPPLNYEFSHNAAYARSLASVYGSGYLPYQYIGLENLTIDGSLSGASEAKTFPLSAICMQNTAYSWIKNVEVKNFMWSGIFLSNGLQNTIAANTVHDGNCWRENHGIMTGDNVTMNVVENNDCYNLWACVVSPWSFGGTGNVYAYNYNHNAIRFYSFINDYTGNDGPAIKISATHPANVAWKNFTYYIHYKGPLSDTDYTTPYSKSASAVGIPLSGSTVPQNRYGIWALDVNTAGNVNVVEGANNYLGYDSADATTTYGVSGYLDILGQEVMNSKVRMGWITVMSTNPGGFIPGVTPLNAPGVTAVFNSRNAQPSGYLLCDYLDNHGAGRMYSLWEGNYGGAWSSDNYHGSNAFVTLFRNRFTGLNPYPQRTGWRMMIEMGKFSYWNNIIGNVLGDAAWTPSTYIRLSGHPWIEEATIYKFGYPNGGNSQYTDAQAGDVIVRPDYYFTHLDPQVYATAALHQNYDYYNKAIKPCGTGSEPCQGITGTTLPVSLYLPSKPSWWCDESAWPPVDPLTGGYSKIPAQRRFEGLACTTGITDAAPPAAPSGLTVR